MPPPSPKGGLPLWALLLILLPLLGLLIFNVIWDATHTDYESVSVSLMLGGIMATAVALDQNAKNKGGDDQ